jgi:hypothetical protein
LLRRPGQALPTPPAGEELHGGAEEPRGWKATEKALAAAAPAAPERRRAWTVQRGHGRSGRATTLADLAARISRKGHDAHGRTTTLADLASSSADDATRPRAKRKGRQLSSSPPPSLLRVVVREEEEGTELLAAELLAAASTLPAAEEQRRSTAEPRRPRWRTRGAHVAPIQLRKRRFKLHRRRFELLLPGDGGAPLPLLCRPPELYSPLLPRQRLLRRVRHHGKRCVRPRRDAPQRQPPELSSPSSASLPLGRGFCL